MVGLSGSLGSFYCFERAGESFLLASRCDRESEGFPLFTGAQIGHLGIYCS
jgi:hypothetical protein